MSKNNRNRSVTKVTKFNSTAIAISAVVAILILALVFIGIGSSWFRNPDVKTWFGLNQQEEPGIVLMSGDIPVAEFASYEISPEAESAKHVYAEYKPENTPNKKTNFLLVWKDANSEWAKGKTVTDYVTLTQDEGKAPHAILQCLKPFGESIELKAVSVANPALSSSTAIEYVAKDWDLYANSGTVNGGYVLIDTLTDTVDTADSVYHGTYTVEPEAVVNVWGYANDNIISALKDANADFSVFAGYEPADGFNLDEFFNLNDGDNGIEANRLILASVLYTLKESSDANIYVSESGTRYLNVGSILTQWEFRYNNEIIATGEDGLEVCVSCALIESLVKAPEEITTPDEIWFSNHQ